MVKKHNNNRVYDFWTSVDEYIAEHGHGWLYTGCSETVASVVFYLYNYITDCETQVEYTQHDLLNFRNGIQLVKEILSDLER